MMAQNFALRLAPEGIGVFELRPGIIATPMTEGVRDRYTARIEAASSPPPLGRTRRHRPDGRAAGHRPDALCHRRRDPRRRRPVHSQIVRQMAEDYDFIIVGGGSAGAGAGRAPVGRPWRQGAAAGGGRHATAIRSTTCRRALRR
jgi:hypothetical protein